MCSSDNGASETNRLLDLDPLSSLKNSIYLSMGLANLPEYSGAPNEDIEEFLRKFARSTTALSKEQKCLALKKAFVGDAAIFLKSYLKSYIISGDWKSLKRDVRKRFSLVDPNLLYRSELSKMVFDPIKTTLMSYVDRYAKLYKKIHANSRDDELIQDISVNLGNHIALKLNQISPDWKYMGNFEAFRDLISRLERDILALETDHLNHATQKIASTVNELVTTALKSPIKEITEILGRLNQRAKEEPVTTEHVAAIKHGQYPPANDDRYRRNYPAKGRERDWEDDRAKQRPKNEVQFNQRLPFVQFKDLMRAYEDKFGSIPGPCYCCGGQHLRRHCPLDPLDLKGLGVRR